VVSSYYQFPLGHGAFLHLEQEQAEDGSGPSACHSQQIGGSSEHNCQIRTLEEIRQILEKRRAEDCQDQNSSEESHRKDSKNKSSTSNINISTQSSSSNHRSIWWHD
jgi:hypothetical protein